MCALRWSGIAFAASCAALAACANGDGTIGGRPDAAGPGAIDARLAPGSDGGPQPGCGAQTSCYSVFAHSDHVLYVVDLQARTLHTIGPFAAPQVMVGTHLVEDVITDLAVAPDNTIYVVSETALYTADAHDGHVTRVGSLAACGTKAVALTTTADGKLYTGDFKGALCQIDITRSPPQVLPAVTMSSGMALTGDLVAIGDGTVFGTAYKLADGAGTATQANNVLVKLDLATGAVTRVGSTGFPKLFGTAFALDQVFGFTHDGTGHVVTIDTTTGAGTIFATFLNPATGTGISFAGAGVNSLVQIIN